MARTKAPRSSLALFPRPTRERALQIVARFPLGSRFVERLTKCQGACCEAGPSHGPYWFLTAPRAAGKPRQRYVGSDEKKREIEAAWEIVAAELAEKEASPAVQELRQLEALAGRRTVVRAARAADVLEVPIYAKLGGARHPPK